jgi:hypothetical protein
MRVGVIGLLVGLVAVSASAAAEMPSKLACIADDAFWTWYGNGLKAAKTMGLPVAPEQKVVGSQISQPEQRYRFDEGKLYLSDPQRPEYLFGDVNVVAFDRVQVGSTVFIFQPDYLSVIAVRVDNDATQIYSAKCIPGAGRDFRPPSHSEWHRGFRRDSFRHARASRPGHVSGRVAFELDRQARCMLVAWRSR